MKKHTHGGNVYQYRNCIDFSANCNPLGTPERVKQAVIESLERVSNYPQVGCRPLREAIAEYEGVNPENIICGNGAAELIFSICHGLRPKRALVPAPTFAEYEQALGGIGCVTEHFYLKEEKDFRITEEFLQALHEELDVVFLCNPNNPTGMLIEKELLLQILERCRALNIMLIVDECFLDFVKKPEQYTLKNVLTEYPNLFLLKAFTKRYAMAGIRLGYGICKNRSFLEQMEFVTQPWNVSALAQAAGLAALKERDYVEAGRQMVFVERDYLISEMEKLGLKVYHSQANYIFFRGPEDLFEKCVEQGVLIRDCSNYPGLEKGFYRIAVKKHEENNSLIRGLKKIQDKDMAVQKPEKKMQDNQR
ncbi:MAG: threonine-phosphate decarboxylase CobD [Lachnospiraceae bacterium]|nr:threonine-phosphate decarboxylase CobD [Lachnospiraceae bacterium]